MQTSGHAHEARRPAQLSVASERWPLREPFRFAGHRLEAFEGTIAHVEHEGVSGRGEAAGIFYGSDTPSHVAATLAGQTAAVAKGLHRLDLLSLLGPGGARNALDCALWELESNRRRIPVWKLLGLAGPPRALVTTFTIGLGTPEVMAVRASEFRAGGARALKIKLDGDPSDLDRVAAVRAACPEQWIGVDPNQAWSFADLQRLVPRLLDFDVSLIEQPLRCGEDERLRGWGSPIPLAVDESFGTSADLRSFVGLYQVANIKLDKCGGLTEALECVRAARALGFRVMVGNMGGTSLGLAPAFLIGQLCDLVDLDGAINLVADREPATRYFDGYVDIAPGTWGHA